MPPASGQHSHSRSAAPWAASSDPGHRCHSESALRRTKNLFYAKPMQTQKSPDDTSWWDKLINAVKPQQPPPPTPQPPPVDQSAWEKSVEQAQISDSLGTVHDLGLRIFGETQSFSDRPDSNEPIDLAREKMAWTIIN